MMHVRPYRPADRTFLLSLAPRLTIGMPPWRDEQCRLDAVRDWINGSIERHGEQAMVFVAEEESGERLGFASVTSQGRFTGERQAYIGELATRESAEGRGVGSALIQACEEWARAQGYRIVALATGAANQRALDFYHRRGYRDEDVTLVKLL
jgi:GNAT superfamily N-acetyltransferase